MNYEDIDSEITTPITTVHKRGDGLTYSNIEPRTTTRRKDHYGGASPDAEELTFSDVDAEVTGSIGALTTTRPTSGDVFSYEILSGNEAGDFTITQGELFRTAEHTLTGPYALVVKVSEGAPLFRSFNVEVAVTVAA